MNKSMDLEKLKEFIKPEELHYPLGIIAKMTGIDAALEIYKEFMSMSLYIPENAINKARNRYIAEHYDGHNIKHLSKITGYSERHVYRILDKKIRPMVQSTIFDVIGK